MTDPVASGPEPLRPAALRPGDPVVVAALSGGLLPAEAPLFARGVDALAALGLEVRLSPLVDAGHSWWWSAGRPEVVADALNQALRDPSVRAVFALTGGRTVLSYLDLVDYDAVRADPKPVVGFSDVSTLLLALYARTGLVGVHGDLVTHGFGEWSDTAGAQRRWLDLYRLALTGRAPLGALPCTRRWEEWRPGRATGHLIGGMLNRIVRLQSTSFALRPASFDGALLFWEETGTSVAAVWNDLHALRSADVLGRIAGMIVGAAPDVADAEADGVRVTLRDVVLDAVAPFAFPVLGNVDVGHALPNLPMPLGVRAAMDTSTPGVALLESPVRHG